MPNLDPPSFMLGMLAGCGGMGFIVALCFLVIGRKRK
jgi:hypothetical protein